MRSSSALPRLKWRTPLLHKTLVIALREYKAAVRTKSFIISLLVMPLMVGGSILLQLLLKDQVSTAPKHFALVDRTPGQQLAPWLLDAVKYRNENEIFDPRSHKQTKPAYDINVISPSTDIPDAIAQQRLELSRRVQHKEIDGFVEIGSHVLSIEKGKGIQKDEGGRMKDETEPAVPSDSSFIPHPSSLPSDALVIRYQSDSPTAMDLHKWVEQVLNKGIEEKRAQTLGLPPGKLGAVIQPVPLLPKGLSTVDPQTGAIMDGRDDNPIVSIFMPAALMIMMFMMVLLGSTPLMQGVVEEKMQRIAEVLLGSVQPFQLMMGKLVGMVGVSLTLAAVYLIGGYWAAHHYQIADAIPVPILIWFVVFQALAVLMYGSLFIAIGAACSDMRETQTMLWPVMLLASCPLFVWFQVVREPNSFFSQVISLFPFATPMLMILRQAVPPGIGWGQPVLGVLLVLCTTLLCVYAAGRIFRVGILMQGKGAHVSDLVRWVFRG
jgi:ABC-2 type transport system permease protein